VRDELEDLFGRGVRLTGPRRSLHGKVGAAERGREPDLRVPGESRLAGLSRIDDAEQVLQPELPAALGVVPGPLDIEEQVPAGRFRQRQQTTVGNQGAVAVAFGIQDLVPDHPVVLAGDLQPGLPLGAAVDVRAHPVHLRQLSQPGEPAPGRDPGALQRPPLPVVIPATSDRSSSFLLRSAHGSRHRQIAQCSTGSG